MNMRGWLGLDWVVQGCLKIYQERGGRWPLVGVWPVLGTGLGALPASSPQGITGEKISFPTVRLKAEAPISKGEINKR